MKSQGFKIDAKSGVVVFFQLSHGKMFSSKAKVGDGDKFNVGIGQLIAMKRNEIAIRKKDIEDMQDMIDYLRIDIHANNDNIGAKLYSQFLQVVHDKIKKSYHHIHELEHDLETLYEGTYDVRPYDEIVKEHRIIRNGTPEEKAELLKKPYVVPKEIIDGTHIFDVEAGRIVIKEI